MKDLSSNDLHREGRALEREAELDRQSAARIRERDGRCLTPVQRTNNPEGKPMGHFTGRCMRCGSTDLWDDHWHYGCNACGAWLL